MLRQKLLTVLGSVVVVLAAATAVAIWMLQGIRQDMDHVAVQAAGLVDETNDLSQAVTAIEMELYELELGRKRHLDDLIAGVESLHAVVAGLGKHYVLQGQAGRPHYDRLQALLPAFDRHVEALATTRDAGLADLHAGEAMKRSIALRREALVMGGIARRHATQERDHLISRFRWLVLGLSLIFLLVIDVAVLILWRTASMILRPMDRLIEASRQLAAERFDHRVTLARKDEFAELAQAFNHLAEQLATHERRRVEMLGQVARALNHELNNTLAIIELQLTLLQENAGGAEGAQRCLRQIRHSMQRMTRAVQSLKHIRRIVLTEYVNGEQMLDLKRSVEAGAPPDGPDADRETPT